MQMTGLHMASRGGHLLVLARLAGAHFLYINKVDTWGFTPLDHAVDTRHWPCAVLLLSMGGMSCFSIGYLSLESSPVVIIRFVVKSGDSLSLYAYLCLRKPLFMLLHCCCR